MISAKQKFLKLKYKIPDIVSTSRRTSSGQLELNWTGYAYDLMLTFDDKGSLQKGIMLLNKIFTEYRLQINITKTKTMIFNQKYTGEAYPTSISSLNGK